MKFISMFKTVSSYVKNLISYLIISLLLNGNQFRAQGMDNQSHKCAHHKCAKSGDNNRNVNNEGSSGGSTNTKFTASEDNRDKDKEDDNNNINSNEGPTHPKPMITNYYCYDQRVYNIYKLNGIQEKTNGLSAMEGLFNIFNWKYIFIAFTLLLCLTVGFIGILCYSGKNEIFDWFIFHKVFGFIFNNHFSVFRSNVPV